MSGKSFAEDPAQTKSKLKARAEEYFKDYDAATDQKVLVEMLTLYNRGLSAEWIPAEVQAAAKKGIEAYVANLFRKSVFASRATLDAFIDKADTDSYRKLEKDPAYRLYASITAFNRDRIQPGFSRIEQQVKRLNKTWLKAQMEMQPDKRFYADANSTLRVSYGKVQGYAPNDAVYYKHFTTLRGIMEKDNPDIYDYDVPERLREIYRLRDFGPYTQDGEVPVCFVAHHRRQLRQSCAERRRSSHRFELRPCLGRRHVRFAVPSRNLPQHFGGYPLRAFHYRQTGGCPPPARRDGNRDGIAGMLR